MEMREKIDHVVLLMLENRSFDTMLGWLYPKGDPARMCPDSEPKSYRGLQDGKHCNSYKGKTFCATRGTIGNTGHKGVGPQPLRVTGFDPGEEFEHVNQQLFGGPDHPTTSNPPYGTKAQMQGFMYDYDFAAETWDQLHQIMEAYTHDQLPVLNGLAGAYAVSDAWYSSVPSQTNPNRAFSLCGTSLGRVNNTADAVEQFKTPTIWNVLPKDTSWGIYYHDIWHDGKCYTEYTFPGCAQKDAIAQGQIATISTFYDRARAGALPAFSYLEPKWGYGKGYLDGGGFYCGKIGGRIYGSQGNDYHPPTWVGPGEAFVNEVYESLIARPDRWARTLLIITFDEHGGTYDHVDPGWGAIQPDDCDGPNGFKFDRYGVRVPTILASPWIPAGTVFRSCDPVLEYDHTSLIRTILKWRGTSTTALGKRAARAPVFDGVLADRTRTDTPRFKVPAGYADQGKSCWITDDAQRIPPSVGRHLTARTRTVEELEAAVAAWIGENF